MTVADFIVDTLIKKGVTDAFGIPGGVILSLVYAFDKRRSEICPHLSYHEQCAGFAACGYAQASGNLGVAYATRGPGFTNLITAIADAYYDSLPVLFITAHTTHVPPENMRIMADQEMDTCTMVRNITKRAVRLDDLSTFKEEFLSLCNCVLEGRKGPVFMDVSSQLFAQEIPNFKIFKEKDNIRLGTKGAIRVIEKCIFEAYRPIILAGDGVNQAGVKEELIAFAERAQIPIVSSRFSHDIACGSRLYYGYVGSHGIRSANFIISKTDLIIALGNRLNFPPKSDSFGNLLEHAHVIRCEIDEGEFSRIIPNCTELLLDITKLLPELTDSNLNYGTHNDWITTCDVLYDKLKETDVNYAVNAIAHILSDIPTNYMIVNDVGNNEFWVSRACVYIGLKNRVLYSKSFGALGCGLGKAIGAYYSTKNPILCFVGDQGLLMNIQELQFISQHQLPIIVVVINNRTSGMIKDKEMKREYFLHTTNDSGFISPKLDKVAEAYGLPYVEFCKFTKDAFSCLTPLIVNVPIPDNLMLEPNLPKGYKCQDLQPSLDKELYKYLNQL